MYVHLARFFFRESKNLQNRPPSKRKCWISRSYDEIFRNKFYNLFSSWSEPIVKFILKIFITGARNSRFWFSLVTGHFLDLAVFFLVTLSRCFASESSSSCRKKWWCDTTTYFFGLPLSRATRKICGSCICDQHTKNYDRATAVMAESRRADATHRHWREPVLDPKKSPQNYFGA